MFLTCWVTAADAFGKTKPQAIRCLRGRTDKKKYRRLRACGWVSDIGNSHNRASLINSSRRRAKKELELSCDDVEYHGVVPPFFQDFSNGGDFILCPKISQANFESGACLCQAIMRKQQERDIEMFRVVCRATGATQRCIAMSAGILWRQPYGMSPMIPAAQSPPYRLKLNKRGAS